MLEVLIALALITILGVALLSALRTSSKTAAQTDEMVTMNSLARTQMEYTKNSPYVSGSPDVISYTLINDPSNPDAIAVPPGYSINVVGHALHQPDDGLQEITVTISRSGKSTALKDYKVNR